VCSFRLLNLSPHSFPVILMSDIGTFGRLSTSSGNGSARLDLPGVSLVE